MKRTYEVPDMSDILQLMGDRDAHLVKAARIRHNIPADWKLVDVRLQPVEGGGGTIYHCTFEKPTPQSGKAFFNGSWLTQDDVHLVVRNLVQGGMSKNPLLAGLPNHFTAGLPAQAEPLAELHVVVDRLNKVSHIDGGVTPLRTFLQNAVLLLSCRTEGHVIQGILDRCFPEAEG